MTSPLTLVKIGGALVDDAGALDALWRGLRRLRETGLVVLVHGGGPQSTALARRLGHEPRMVHGRRVTTDLDRDILLWTLRGALNARLVAGAQAAGLNAAGVSGADGGLLRVTRRPPWTVDGEDVDFGWVGDVAGVHPAVLHALLAGDFVPVVAPVGLDDAGELYNVNADTVAGALAAALGASALWLVTGSGGVRRDPADPATHLAEMPRATFDVGVRDGWIAGGMRPKLTVGFDALSAGVGTVTVAAPDSLATGHGGTRLVADRRPPTTDGRDAPPPTSP